MLFQSAVEPCTLWAKNAVIEAGGRTHKQKEKGNE